MDHLKINLIKFYVVYLVLIAIVKETSQSEIVRNTRRGKMGQ